MSMHDKRDALITAVRGKNADLAKELLAKGGLTKVDAGRTYTWNVNTYTSMKAALMEMAESEAGQAVIEQVYASFTEGLLHKVRVCSCAHALMRSLLLPATHAL
jgi:hypothetical protein